jgi:hypothetical protein
MNRGAGVQKKLEAWGFEPTNDFAVDRRAPRRCLDIPGA